MISLRTAGLAVLLAVPSPADEKVTPNYFNIPGTDTRLKIYSTVWVNSWYYFNQNLKDAGALVAGDADPLNANAAPDRQFGMTAKNSRFGFTTTTPSAGLGDITTMIEMDFSRDQRKNGGANLRHAYLAAGNWIVGHTWSNWLDLDATGATVDMNGPVGQACNGSSRFTQIRYTCPLSKRASLAFSLEQNKMAWGAFEDVVNAPKPPTVPDARYPTLIGAWTFADRWGHVAVRALQQNYGAFTPQTATAPESRPNRWGGAVQLSGAVNLGKDLLVASVYTGEALGEYGTGIQGARLPSDGRFLFYRNEGWQAGYTHAWSDRVRSNLVVGGVNFHNDTAALPQDIRSSLNGFVNTFVKLGRNMELGLEYGYENLHTFGPDQVLDRNATRSGQNRSNKLQVSLTATF